MRISFFGKGGSGKTTMTTEFVKYLQGVRKASPIVAIDADINVHLGKALDMKTRYLGDIINELSYYFEGTRNQPLPRTTEAGKKYYKFIRSVEDFVCIGQMPPSFTSNFIRPYLDDRFFKYFATVEKNTALITIGSYTDAGVGVECFHGKLGALELIYNRLLDDKNMYVVTDSTAGVDSVGTSLFFASDVNIFVVEPTIKGISVFQDFERITKNYKLNNYVLINKITGQDDIDFIERNIPKEKIIGYVSNSNSLKRFEQGNKDAFNDFIKENEEINKKMLDILDNTQKDWDRYYAYLLKCYVDNCKDWYSQYYGQDLLQYIDPDFNYEEAIKNNV
ncbi:MAG: hypothetical protein IJW82_04245 [Clostridia bacterium]|nr:hypothetical protein [Clostridia bacterium]